MNFSKAMKPSGSLSGRRYPLAFLLVIAIPMGAHAVDINGGTSWSGWDYVGHSQMSGTWVLGSTNRTYDIHRTIFVLGSGQTVGGNRLNNGAVGNGTDYTGDTASSLFSGSWQAGDRILGIGLRYTGTTRGSTFFFHKDAGGDNIFAASSFGAGDGVFSHDVGDTSSYILHDASAARGRVRQYSVFNSFTQNGGSNFATPYGTTPDLAMPTRSFSVLESGSLNRVTSIQYLLNIDAVQRSNGGLTFGDGEFGPSTTFGFREFDGTGSTQQIFAVPEPFSMLALAGGLAALARRRRAR
jgi:hypothetical protein